MDPNTALELVKQGVTLLLLDVPQYTLFGIDTQVLLLILYSSSSSSVAFTYIYSSINQSMWQMFSVGPAFKGIKMIPPASHFLYYTSSTRLGYFNFQKSSCSCNLVIVFLCDFCLQSNFQILVARKDGKDFSPIIGFFIHAAPSEVSNAFTLFPTFLLQFIVCSIRSAFCRIFHFVQHYNF